MFCVWTSAGDSKEVLAQDNESVYTESVNTFTTGWLDVAKLFNTFQEAVEFNEKYDIGGVIYNVGQFIEIHSAISEDNDD
jgi:hypothetical protein